MNAIKAITYFIRTGCLSSFINKRNSTTAFSSHGVRYYWLFGVLFFRPSSAGTMMEGSESDLAMFGLGSVCIRESGTPGGRSSASA